MKRKLTVFAIACLLLCASFSALASFIVVGPDGHYYECWYDGGQLKCQLLDYMPPIEP